MKYAEGNIDSKERGTCARANGGKPKMSLVPLNLLGGASRIFMGGQLKYDTFNWAKGSKYSVAFDSLMRHMIAWYYCKEDLDPETMESHIDHAICNLLMLKHFELTYQDGDDRPDGEMTGFPDTVTDFKTKFNEEDYLDRNPAVKEMVEKRNDIPH